MIETITLAYLVSQCLASEHLVQAKNIFLPCGSTRVTCRNTLLNDSNDRHFVSDLLSLSILLLCFFVCPTCDVICKMEETIRMQILAYFISKAYFYVDVLRPTRPLQ